MSKKNTGLPNKYIYVMIENLRKTNDMHEVLIKNETK